MTDAAKAVEAAKAYRCEKCGRTQEFKSACRVCGGSHMQLITRDPEESLMDAIYRASKATETLPSWMKGSRENRR